MLFVFCSPPPLQDMASLGPSTSVFGDFSVAFSHPQEFSLPDHILPSSALVSSKSALGAGRASTPLPDALDAARCSWSVVRLPPSVSAATITIAPAKPNGMNISGGQSISEAADTLFLQALETAAASLDVDGSGSGKSGEPLLYDEQVLLSNISPEASLRRHPYGFLRIGVDPHEPLPPGGVSLPTLVTAMGILAETYGLVDGVSTTETTQSMHAAEAFGGLFSKNAILFLAWQRVSQLINEGRLTNRLKMAGLKRPRDDTRNQLDSPNVESSTLSTAFAVTSEDGFEAKVEHLRALSSLLEGRVSNGTFLTCKGVQTSIQIPALNTTSPFATLPSANSADVGAEVEAALERMLVPTAVPCGLAATLITPASTGLTVKVWNAKVGLMAAEAKTIEFALSYGVTTMGARVAAPSFRSLSSSFVDIADLVEAPPSSKATRAPNQLLRLLVKPDPLNEASPIILGIPCGGAAGIRVEGRQWRFSEPLQIAEHDVVHAGHGIAFTIRRQPPQS